MIRLEQWPYNAAEQLNLLYSQTDQSGCLVRLPVPLPYENTVRYINGIRQNEMDGRPFLCRAVYEDDTCIGKIELTRYEDMSAEIDIILRKEWCHQGFGTEALRQMIELVRAMDWCVRIHAYVDTSNIAAGKLFAKSGFAIGGFFNADVLTSENGEYVMVKKRGCEMILDI